MYEVEPTPVVGTVQLTGDQLAKIMAEYRNGGECSWYGEIKSELRDSHRFDRDPN
jgi:hypothetical protein